ncbi:MAG: hypothetical protein F7C38_08060 [Desulfurococcales archaeon]|nr:hypothetical protein [Desulfurococcales archaeon]
MRALLKGKGFQVSAKKVVHATLTGEMLEENRLTAYSSEGGIKVTYSEFSDGRKRLSIVIHGPKATRDREEKAILLGGRVDLNERERLYAVFDVRSKSHAEEIIDEILRGENST